MDSIEVSFPKGTLGICSECDQWIDTGTGTMRWCKFENPVKGFDGLPDIEGIWEAVHYACIQPGDKVQDDD